MLYQCVESDAAGVWRAMTSHPCCPASPPPHEYNEMFPRNPLAFAFDADLAALRRALIPESTSLPRGRAQPAKDVKRVPRLRASIFPPFRVPVRDSEIGPMLGDETCGAVVDRTR